TLRGALPISPGSGAGPDGSGPGSRRGNGVKKSRGSAAEGDPGRSGLAGPAPMPSGSARSASTPSGSDPGVFSKGPVAKGSDEKEGRAEAADAAEDSAGGSGVNGVGSRPEEPGPAAKAQEPLVRASSGPLPYGEESGQPAGRRSAGHAEDSGGGSADGSVRLRGGASNQLSPGGDVLAPWYGRRRGGSPGMPMRGRVAVNRYRRSRIAEVLRPPGAAFALCDADADGPQLAVDDVLAVPSAAHPAAHRFLGVLV